MLQLWTPSSPHPTSSSASSRHPCTRQSPSDASKCGARHTPTHPPPCQPLLPTAFCGSFHLARHSTACPPGPALALYIHPAGRFSAPPFHCTGVSNLRPAHLATVLLSPGAVATGADTHGHSELCFPGNEGTARSGRSKGRGGAERDGPRPRHGPHVRHARHRRGTGPRGARHLFPVRRVRRT